MVSEVLDLLMSDQVFLMLRSNLEYHNPARPTEAVAREAVQLIQLLEAWIASFGGIMYLIDALVRRPLLSLSELVWPVLRMVLRVSLERPQMRILHFVSAMAEPHLVELDGLCEDR